MIEKYLLQGLASEALYKPSNIRVSFVHERNIDPFQRREHFQMRIYHQFVP